MLVTCFSTARSVTTSSSAIAWFDRPSAMSPSTSRSRGVSSPNRIVAAATADELRDDARVERGAAFRDAAHCRAEVVDVRNAVLEEVADALGALRQELHRVAGLDVLREDEHGGVGVLLADLLRRDEPLVGVRGRHADVDDRDVGVVGADLQQQLLGVAGLADDLEAAVLEQAWRSPRAERTESSARTTRVVPSRSASAVPGVTIDSKRREVKRQARARRAGDPLGAGRPRSSCSPRSRSSASLSIAAPVSADARICPP
jgi:hypothetical protein